MMIKALKQVKSQIELEFPSREDAEIVLRSIEPEIRGSPSERTSTEIECQINILKITITARDTTSLRASLNSYLRWVMLSQQILELKH
ncbi:KEOPS complex subunit Pcc1 [Methanobacterium sp.]|uniref:KEOPS complex subunit Pcc1 n=1 Tax=Methanobacterium sp. TaxID=2164 RepID=UPI002ABCD05B|nr:KEOPS complex subunit Pcc1 [Methanobacterium sp.]MDY9923339.1 KEOPS complex subunit Pcc1 [Methanobacterium sp.]